ncbi:uncharacterized protein RMCC_0009 [Mycolicibacterium canariasense]|uniref:Uncharacterized protein n=1 Tax=Mycolicibacterium canariasense TaxID=228230 RepID=A0A100W7H7_MYCCR|nr:hypothetical protein [Mycolicibacterium canariasense]MCV7211073.1 hypothetical protein [Mycolicibacterium canariasense]GAS93042.1 uncharacterized protein RMCC_0009 [Mycolicibacterium canariasense]
MAYYARKDCKDPDLPLSEVARAAKAGHDSFENPLFWVKVRIETYVDVAPTGILKMYG